MIEDTTISVEQIKAARALLDWNQDDLANAATMSKPALANLERRTANPRYETLRSIEKALVDAGIEFTDGPGVKLRGEHLNVQIFEGDEALGRLWNDICDTLSPGEERLISNVSEDMYISKVSIDRYERALNRFHKKGVRSRILCVEGDDNFFEKRAKYRWIPKAHFSDIPFYVYADKFAILVFEPEMRVLLIENRAISDNYRAQFEWHWKNGQLPPGQEEN